MMEISLKTFYISIILLAFNFIFMGWLEDNFENLYLKLKNISKFFILILSCITLASLMACIIFF